VSVTFGFDKSVLTDDDKAQLDQVAASLTARGLHSGVDRARTRWRCEYNYKLSNRRRDAVVNYLSIKYNIPPHKFYLIGIGRITRWRTTTLARDVRRTVASNQADVEHGEECLTQERFRAANKEIESRWESQFRPVVEAGQEWQLTTCSYGNG